MQARDKCVMSDDSCVERGQSPHTQNRRVGHPVGESRTVNLFHNFGCICALAQHAAPLQREKKEGTMYRAPTGKKHESKRGRRWLGGRFGFRGGG
jgi:hypothetical protein